MVVAKQYKLQQHFVGEPKPTDLLLEEVELPPIGDGGRLLQFSDHHCIGYKTLSRVPFMESKNYSSWNKKNYNIDQPTKI